MTGVRGSLRARYTRARRIIAVALAVVTLAACTPTASTSTEATTTLLPPPRTVLRVGVEDWPTCLNPLLCVEPALENQILQHVLPGAYRLNADNEYAPTGLLTDPAEVSTGKARADGTASMTIRYRLNPDARWSDGKPITSSDFVGTWRAVMTTPGADTRGYALIENVDDRDPLVAVVTLKDVFADWRELFGGAHNHLLKADAFGATTDLTGLYESELPFAAGPYQVASWSENEAVLARVDNDWDPGRTAEIDQVRYRPVSIDEVSPESFDVVLPSRSRMPKTPEGYSVQEAPTTRVVGVWFDQRAGAVQVPAHRRFLMFGLNRELMAEAADSVAPVAGTLDCPGWVPTVGPWCEAANIELPYDSERALAILGGEEWVPSEEGKLTRGEDVLTFTVTWDPADTAAAAVSGEVAQELTAYGITVDLQSMPTAEWLGPRGPDAGVGIGVYTIDLGVGPSTPAIYDCPSGQATSVIAWCPEANAETVATLASTVDRDLRTTLVNTLARRVQADSSWLPIVQLADSVYIRTDRVTAPELTRAVGGPLAHLAEFTVIS